MKKHYLNHPDDDMAQQQTRTEEDAWTALGNFSNAWYDYAHVIRATLVREP